MPQDSKQTNVIIILADDMGYGDVSGLNPDAAFHTPNLDRMIHDGLHFKDAHTSSAVCTPSRYSLLTGRYCWRTYLKKGVLSGIGGPLIEPERETLATVAKRAGYDTACIGKWHVGWNWAVKPGNEDRVDRSSWDGDSIDWIDYSAPIQNGPTTIGFDHFYGISGSLDMPPYVYVEDDLAVEEPTAWASKSEFVREGPRMESMRANNVLGYLTDKAVSYIEDHDSDKPFLLYFPLTAPHTPISPAPEYDGISGVSPYADFCMEVDGRVGQIFDALKQSGQLEDTLLVFTTDNGASSIPSECAMLEKRYGHHCSHVYRGYKSDIWDGGHRIPFLMHWPDGIEPGSCSEQCVGIFDLFATLADLNKVETAVETGPDSLSLLPALKGEKIDDDNRWALIHHSIDGRFAIRVGDWKLCRCPGSGGWTEPRDQRAREWNLPEVQLYNMATDPSETTNLASTMPEKVKELTQTLHRCVVTGRSTSGPAIENVVTLPVEKWTQIDWMPEIPERFVIDD